jgi:hypothetical protein
VKIFKKGLKMKKKIVITWVLVIAFAICTVPAFAQQKLSNLTVKTLERQWFWLEDWSGNVQKYTTRNNNKMNMDKDGKGQVVHGVYVETGSNGVAYFFGYTAGIGQIPTKKIFIKVGPNSRVDVTAVLAKNGTQHHVLTLAKGTWQEDKGAKELAQFDELINLVNCAEYSSGHKIADQVANWKKSGTRTKDQLADYVITQKSTKTGFLGGIAGIGGALSGPNQFLALLADFMVQAELAYAVACVYRDTPPTTKEFQKDLYFLLCDDDVVDAALKEMGSQLTDKVVDQVMKIADKKIKEIMANVAKRQTSKLAQKAATTTGTKAIPVLSTFVSASANFSAAKAFGEKAKKYYKK